MGKLRDMATGYRWQSIPSDVRVEMLEADARMERMEKAITEIGVWLSGSLGDDCCQEYREACDAIFACDPSLHSGSEGTKI